MTKNNVFVAKVTLLCNEDIVDNFLQDSVKWIIFSDDFVCINELHPTNVKHLYMVDAGLTFNSPYPPVLRRQRAVDIILSFDFSARPSDSTPAFEVRYYITRMQLLVLTIRSHEVN